MTKHISVVSRRIVCCFANELMMFVILNEVRGATEILLYVAAVGLSLSQALLQGKILSSH